MVLPRSCYLRATVVVSRAGYVQSTVGPLPGARNTKDTGLLGCCFSEEPCKHLGVTVVGAFVVSGNACMMSFELRANSAVVNVEWLLRSHDHELGWRVSALGRS